MELVERMKSSQQQVDAKVHVFKFVLTGLISQPHHTSLHTFSISFFILLVLLFLMATVGGPCSGKTTAFQIIKSYLEGYDYRVYMVPEAATMLFINGVSFDDLNYPERQYAMQQSVLRSLPYLLITCLPSSHDLSTAFKLMSRKLLRMLPEAPVTSVSCCAIEAVWMARLISTVTFTVISFG
jgi:hypothetical protein